MAITASQTNQLNVLRMASGYYHDTAAAAFTITVGFKPRYVKIVNLGATGLASIEWFEGMADASGLLVVTDGTTSVDVSTGITVSASGFTFGINTDINIADEQMAWIALG